jgi:hypothetical protein
VRRARWLSILAAGLVLAGCAGRFASDPTPDRPGTRVTVRNPDPERWIVVRLPQQPAASQNAQFSQTLWSCRKLVCANNDAAVLTQTSPSTTRSPDRQALERIAKIIPAQAKAQDAMLEATSDGDERMTALGTRITEVRNYPAILSEFKRTSKTKTLYHYRGDLFVGMVLVRVVVATGDRAEAKRNFESFVAALDIIDFAPGPSPEPASVALENPS